MSQFASRPFGQFSLGNPNLSTSLVFSSITESGTVAVSAGKWQIPASTVCVVAGTWSTGQLALVLAAVNLDDAPVTVSIPNGLIVPDATLTFRR